MPAWIVTSSAVVGSSATSTFGSHASAIAIITRWRMPPDSWCGYSRTRRLGAGIRTRSSSSTARLSAARRDRSRWRCNTSAICRPTRKDGFSDVIGSWNTNAISRPRILRISRDDAFSRSVPLKRAVPSIFALAGKRPRRLIRLTLFPQPDSPTMPSTSRSARSNERLSTACTTPSSVSKRTLSASTAKSGRHQRVVRGSRMSRSPSPSKLNESEQKKIASPGYSASRGAVLR